MSGYYVMKSGKEYSVLYTSGAPDLDKYVSGPHPSRDDAIADMDYRHDCIQAYRLIAVLMVGLIVLAGVAIWGPEL